MFIILTDLELVKEQMIINSQTLIFIFSILIILIIFFDLNKKVKKKLFNEIVDWIKDEEPNYPSFGEYKSWIKKKSPISNFKKLSERKSNVAYLYTYKSTNE